MRTIVANATTGLIIALLGCSGLTLIGCGADDVGGAGLGGVAGEPGAETPRGTGQDGPLRVGTRPKIEVNDSGASLQDGDSIVINTGTAAPGTQVTVATLVIINTDTGTLEVYGVSTDRPDVYEVVPVDGGSASDLTTVEEGESYAIDVRATIPADGVLPEATLTVESNSVQNAAEQLDFRLEVEGAEPRIEVLPSAVEFGSVSDGETKNQAITILNTGKGDLRVTGMALSGSPAFTFILAGAEYPATAETAAEGVTFAEALVVPPGTSTGALIRFTPLDSAAAEGTLVLFSNDPTSKSGHLVPISGNRSGPCISINPGKVDFGGKLIGQQASVEVEILSCGESPLTIREISIVDRDDGLPSSSDFGLELNEFVGGEPGGEAPALSPADAPVELPVNVKRTFQVTFTPDALNSLDELGQPIPDLGRIRIVSDAFESVIDVAIRGFGVEDECPTAVIVVQEGEEVIPQTKLHLVGSQSYGAGASISKFEWSAQQPAGSQSVFLPSAAAPDPTFTVNVAGPYHFELRVWDGNGQESCVRATALVFVNPDEAIHVELLWHTPSDPDETDSGPEAGADLDLHFLHPFATGEDVDGDGTPDGWFDQPFDAFWFNAHPNWGSLDPSVDDNPGLDLDDVDGAGPENVNLNIPEDGHVYKVGVHYWNDHGYGPSLATVRIYIYSSLVFEVSDVELVQSDMWEVACIAWPSGEVTLKTGAGGGYDIIPNYEHPFFPSPQ